MTEYNVVQSQHLDMLIEDVNAMLEDGWRLQGGVGVGYGEHSRGSGRVYAQAMVKD